MRKLSNSSSKGLALLRGINIGGKRMLPMKDLAAIFTAAGCSDVRTYIQSGNVIFSAAPTVSKGLSGLITAEIEQRFGHRVPVILRTFEEMEQTICDNPFLKVGASEEALHVYFLANTPNAAAAGSLDPDRSPPDAFQVVNRDVYVHLPNGMGRTKLTNGYFDSKLSTTSTARNWRTVLKLFELMNTQRP